MPFRRKYFRKDFKHHKAEERKQIALERVQTLSQIILGNPSSPHVPRQMKTISAICRKFKIQFPRSFAGKTCRVCGRPKILGKTFLVRIKNKKSVKICACGKVL